jgi:hypothetical protein
MRKLAPIVLAGLAALALGACGGSSATTTTDTRSDGQGTGDTTPTATKTVATVTETAPATTSSTSGSATSSTSVGPTPCRASGMALSYLGGQGATGHGLLGFALRNTGSSSCSTVGYPGIQFLDKSGGDLPTTPTRTTNDFFGPAPLKPLVVAGGGKTSFRLGVTHVAGSGGACTTAYGLQVIPPNDTQTLKVTIPGGAYECGGAATVSPMQPGTSAYG